ncbi:hypothetical protein H0H87_000185 [Tephrocybe sp. NHM501043]|nr:hypothetical protein H0H87_000185 [Tephrocybe sp. NHM501043]
MHHPLTGLLVLLTALPLFAAAQSSTATGNGNGNGTSNASQVVFTSTTVSTFETIGPDRQISTGTRTIVITSTSTIAPTQSASNNTASGNNTASASPSGNNTSSSSATRTTILPTAPTDVAAGGGANGAPLPGATGGAYGPDDKYIAAASSLARNTLLVGLGGLVVSGALMML